MIENKYSTPKLILYNASAGTGKTTAMIKSFMELTLKSLDTHYFSKILATTFTNKATNEIKEKWINNLYQICNNPSEVKHLISLELQFFLDKNPKIPYLLLERMLHNYGEIHIHTIDSFFSSILNSFKTDLDLDEHHLIINMSEYKEKINQLFLNNVSKNELLKEQYNKQLIRGNFHGMKGIDGVSAKISDNYYKKFLPENLFDNLKFREIIETFETETIRLRKTLLENSRDFKFYLDDLLGESKKGVVDKNFIKIFDEFSNEDFWKAYDKLKAKLEGKTCSKLLGDFEIFNKRKKPVNFDEDKLLEFVRVFRENIGGLIKLEIAYEKILEFWNAIEHKKSELEYKNKNKILTLNDVVEKINHIIDDNGGNNTFLYERVGLKFKHIFIDEFQDTSFLQWKNFEPLVLEVCQEEENFSMLVGDPKQAIYKFRGGDVDNFLNIFKNGYENLDIEHKNLVDNYRSAKEIIDFVRDFYLPIAQKTVSSLVENLEIYQGEFNSKKASDNSGKVEVHVFKENFSVGSYNEDEGEEDDEGKIFSEPNNKVQPYIDSVYDILLEARQKGYKDSDICIMSGSNKDLLVLSKGLDKKNHKSDTKFLFTLKESVNLKEIPTIKLLYYLSYCIFYKPQKTEMSIFLTLYCQIYDSKIDFFELWKGIDFSEENIDLKFLEEKILAPLDLYIQIDKNHKTDIFGDFILVARALGIDETEDYLKFIQKLTNIPNNSYDWENIENVWNENYDFWKIETSEQENKVLLSTVHKTKGLEYPIVIFIKKSYNKSIKENLWLDKNCFPSISNIDTKLSFLPINPSSIDKLMPYLSDEEVKTLKQQMASISMDRLNVEYVAITRAKQALYVLTSEEANYKDTIEGYFNQKMYASLDKNVFAIGDLPQNKSEKIISSQEIKTPIQRDKIQNDFPQSPNLYTSIQQEIGNIFHKAVNQGLFRNKNFNKNILKKHLQSSSKISLSEKNLAEIIDWIVKTLEYRELEMFFSSKNFKYIERTIRYNGENFRPDVFVIEGDTVNILDFKTGKKEISHQDQLKRYAKIFDSQGYSIGNLYLFYTNPSELVKVLA